MLMEKREHKMDRLKFNIELPAILVDLCSMS